MHSKRAQTRTADFVFVRGVRYFSRLFSGNRVVRLEQKSSFKSTDSGGVAPIYPPQNLTRISRVSNVLRITSLLCLYKRILCTYDRANYDRIQPDSGYKCVCVCVCVCIPNILSEKNKQN